MILMQLLNDERNQSHRGFEGRTEKYGKLSGSHRKIKI